ncbi:hypothetical protein [Bdellovibrio svalbardensis]|uniref:Uncharacterized protein n=1 Tax=Bdellovibrio svalbardensis TaxID=2972972 RepID=A0ABT6DDU2_9BACT|nr:hypothetical protein [Bdellovibrio svalbardensis]MDG0814988.1 hypothetical protein [Bdellovibrio svalbardensis]
MSRILALFVLSASIITSVIAQGGNKGTPAPFTSKELLDFVGRGDLKFIDFGKTADFVGVVTRTHEQSDARIADVYEFKDIQAVPMDKGLCEKILEKIFGPLDKISLRVKKIEIFASHTGKTCEAQLDDEDQQAKIPERRVIAGFLNAKPRALVFKMTRKSAPKEQESIRKFWDTLR